MFGWIFSLLIGGIAGFLAAKLTGNDSSNILQNICLGLVGGLVGEFLGNIIGLGSTNFIGSLILATLGAILILYLYNHFIKK